MHTAFTKMCGAGNDFLITDLQRIKKLNPHAALAEIQSYIKEQTPQLCHRKFGIGADGVCFLFFKENHSETALPALQWQFLNSDGSTPDMCGNAACCMIHYAYQRNITQKTPFIFQIKNNCLTGEIKNKKEAWLRLPRPQFLNENSLETTETAPQPIHKIHSGVPHLLIESAQAEKFEKLTNLAQSLRQKHPHFNITFYKKIEEQKIFCVTFEKGVEDFTLACGTGALAAAHILHKKDHSVLSVQMPGGMLKVLFDKNKAYLHSPVHWIAEITV